MIIASLALVLAMQEDRVDLPAVQPPAARATKDGKPKRIKAKTAKEAANMDVADPDTQICVRQQELGSRIKFNMVCQTQAGWMAQQGSVNQMGNDFKTQNGRRIIDDGG